MAVAKFGMFWSSVSEDFPHLEEAPRLPHFIEPSKLSADMQPLSVVVGQSPRLMLWAGSQDFVLQIQTDRFSLNWRKVTQDAEYPRFVMVSDQFEKYLSKFKRFIAEIGVADLSYDQYELTYVNVIDCDVSPSDSGPEGLFIDHKRDTRALRFLPTSESAAWSSSYRLPESQGRLHVASTTAIQMDNPGRGQVVKVDLTARGFGLEKSDESRQKWFALAHNWIVKGFSDLVDLDVQKKWGRK
jgi:uncharacterized protein (TIGR04255 family)